MYWKRLAKGDRRQTQLNLVFKYGIREGIFWGIGSTQERKEEKKKKQLNLNQIVARGKVTRYVKAETKQEETLFLYVPCLCGALQRVTHGNAPDRGIITSLQELADQLNQSTHK